MDPYTMQQLGEAHLDELRRDAAIQRAAVATQGRAPVMGLRRATGSMMVRAGTRLMGARATITVVDACEAGG